MSPEPKPTKLKLRPILGRIANGYRHDWKLLLLVGLLVFIPVGLVTAIHPSEGYEFDDWSGNWLPVLIALIVTQTALPLLGGVFYSGVVAAGEQEREWGTRHGIGHIARTLPYWTLILADIALVFVVAFGFLLLIVPGIIFLAWYSLIAPVIEIERLGVRAAFRRSRELVRPHLWRVIGIALPLLIVQALLEDGGERFGHGLLGDTFLGNWLASVTANLLGAPLYALTVLALYFEIVARERSFRRLSRLEGTGSRGGPSGPTGRLQEPLARSERGVVTPRQVDLQISPEPAVRESARPLEGLDPGRTIARVPCSPSLKPDCGPSPRTRRIAFRSTDPPLRPRWNRPRSRLSPSSRDARKSSWT